MTTADVSSRRIGAVRFVNTMPLIDGLDRLAGCDVRFAVPSRLIDALLADEVDVALCSSVDYQRSPEPLVILPAGLLGCDGCTLTVRVYADRPVDRIERVYCDTDSHTSISLMRILLRERYGIDPECVPYEAREHAAEGEPLAWPDAMLLIGDKVVTDSPPAVRYPHQLDLGAEWRAWTGLPFVFATWVAKATTAPERLRAIDAILDRQRRANVERIGTIVHRAVRRHRWPLDLATAYLTRYIRYAFDPRYRRGLEHFFAKLDEHGLAPGRRPVELLAA